MERAAGEKKYIKVFVSVYHPAYEKKYPEEIERGRFSANSAHTFPIRERCDVEWKERKLSRRIITLLCNDNNGANTSGVLWKGRKSIKAKFKNNEINQNYKPNF